MNKVFAKAIGCAIAGTLAWIICEPAFPKTVAGSATPRWAAVEMVFIFLIGGFIGLVAGILHGMFQGGTTNLAISSALGFIFGAMGAGFGHTIAGLVFSMLGGSAFSATNMVARTFAFIPLGLLIGAAVGASQRSVRGLVSGAIGGAIAGFVTGAAFDPISTMMSSFSFMAQAQNAASGTVEIGAPGRATLAAGLGLFIGLFTSIVDLVTRQAWLRLVLGRNEGREWPIDAAQTLIGRDERAHIPVFSDPSIPSLAAVIVRQGGQYVLQDPGSPIGVGHNGVRVHQAVLSNGDSIQIGPLMFQFMMKAGHGGAFEGRAKGVAVGGQPHPPQMPGPVTGMPAQPTQWPTGARTMQQQPVQPSMPTQAIQTPVSQPSFGIVVTSGPLTGQRVSVTGNLEIGREATGLSLPTDAQASRRHAQLVVSPGGLQVTDLGSTNGTYVNGNRVQTSLLSKGDVLTIGSTTFRVD